MKNQYHILILLLTLISSCSDKKVPMFGKEIKPNLSLEIIKKAEQIYIYKDDLILLYNHSNRQDIYEPYLLFYNKEREFLGYTYYSSEKIDTINNSKIEGILNIARVHREDFIESDIPKMYSINLLPKRYGGGERLDKVITNIDYNTVTTNLTLSVKKALDRYEGLDEFAISNYLLDDTLTFELSKLHFNFLEKEIEYRYLDEYNNIVRDQMLVIESSLLDQFYTALYSSLVNE